MVEHRSPKPRVAGSSPVSPAIKNLRETLIKISKMNNIVSYVKESYNELLHHVTWPTMSELLSSARVVLIATIILALIILVLDFIFNGLLLERFLYQIGVN